MKNMNYYYDFSGQKFGHPLSLSMNSFDRNVFSRQGSLELSYILKGEYEVITDVLSGRLGEHELVLIAPGDIHMIRKTGTEPDSVILTVHIDLERFPSGFLGEWEGAFLTLVCTRDRNAELLEELRRLLGWMVSVLLEDEGCNLFALNACMMEILYLASGRSKYPIDRIPLSGQGRISYMEAIRFIDHSHREPLRLEDVAGALHFSVSYTSRLFKRYAGIPFVRYLARVRVRASLDELLGGEKPIGRIAVDCGMPNVRAYTEAFREMYGVTPSVYRKLFRENKAMDSGGRGVRELTLDGEKKRLLAHLLTEIRELEIRWPARENKSAGPGISVTGGEAGLTVLIGNEASVQEYNERLIRLRIEGINGRLFRQERRTLRRTGEIRDSQVFMELEGRFYEEYRVGKNEILELRFTLLE